MLRQDRNLPPDLATVKSVEKTTPERLPGAGLSSQMPSLAGRAEILRSMHSPRAPSTMLVGRAGGPNSSAPEALPRQVEDPTGLDPVCQAIRGMSTSSQFGWVTARRRGPACSRGCGGLV